MLTGPSKHRLIDLLERFPVDFLLFSGGGNDVVGRHDFDFLLRAGVPSSGDFRAYLQADRLERRLSMIEAVYRELLEFCDEYSRNPAIRVVTHCYDYALPSPRGARFAGGLVRPGGGRSWLLPALRKKGVPERHHAPIARHLIDRLAEGLLRLARARPDRLIVADTRGTLSPERWLNEIHPDTRGFERLARRILDSMRETLPRV